MRKFIFPLVICTFIFNILVAMLMNTNPASAYDIDIDADIASSSSDSEQDEGDEDEGDEGDEDEGDEDDEGDVLDDTLEIDDTDCLNFDKNNDGVIDQFEYTLCRGKKNLEHFKKGYFNIDCSKWDANGDGLTDDDDIRACKVYKARTQTKKAELEALKLKKEGELKKFRPQIFAIRWGTLQPSIDDQDDDENPNPTNYSGEIKIVGGNGKIIRPILFEEDDLIINRVGPTLSWESTICDDLDGVLVRIIPKKPIFDTEGDVFSNFSITLSIGDFSETFVLSDDGENPLLGIHEIGNEHQVDVRNISQLDLAPKNISTAVSDRFLENKEKVFEKMLNVEKKFREFREAKVISKQSFDKFDGIRQKINTYNFYGEGAAKMEEDLAALIENSRSEGLSSAEISEKIMELQKNFEESKVRARLAKFRAGLVPFKDIDDDIWYGQFVTYAKDNNIVSGYSGNREGEYGPGDPVTIAEVLKMALVAADQGEAETIDPRHPNHWAAKFFQKARNLNLTLGTEDNPNPNRPATRKEVAGLILEALGIIPPDTLLAPFSDVSTGNPYATAIAYLKQTGVISGDSTGNTFRPNDPINRAEVAKVIKNMVEILKSQL